MTMPEQVVEVPASITAACTCLVKLLSQGPQAAKKLASGLLLRKLVNTLKITSISSLRYLLPFFHLHSHSSLCPFS